MLEKLLRQLDGVNQSIGVLSCIIQVKAGPCSRWDLQIGQEGLGTMMTCPYRDAFHV
jgi:hypothetical protein